MLSHDPYKKFRFVLCRKNEGKTLRTGRIYQRVTDENCDDDMVIVIDENGSSLPYSKEQFVPIPLRLGNRRGK